MKILFGHVAVDQQVTTEILISQHTSKGANRLG